PCDVSFIQHSFGWWWWAPRWRRLGWWWRFRRWWRAVRGRRSQRIMVMTRKKLIRIIDQEKIKEAIQKAEHRTSGEIRVSVAPFFWGNVHKAAEKAFTRLGMKQTKDRKGILFFVVHERRQLVVIGDRGLHEKVRLPFSHRYM